MAEAARRGGIDMVLALQPTIYTTDKKMTGAEADLLESLHQRYPGFEQTYLRNFNEFKAAIAGLDAYGATVIDLSDVLDQEPTPLFIDASHTIDRGYELVAEALVDVIRRNSLKHRDDQADQGNQTGQADMADKANGDNAASDNAATE